MSDKTNFFTREESKQVVKAVIDGYDPEPTPEEILLKAGEWAHGARLMNSLLNLVLRGAVVMTWKEDEKEWSFRTRKESHADTGD